MNSSKFENCMSNKEKYILHYTNCTLAKSNVRSQPSFGILNSSFDRIGKIKQCMYNTINM